MWILLSAFVFFFGAFSLPITHYQFLRCSDVIVMDMIHCEDYGLDLDEKSEHKSDTKLLLQMSDAISHAFTFSFT